MESVLARFALEGRRIDSKSLHQPVGYFVGLHEPVSQMDYSGPLPDETIAVLYGLADQVIQQLLAAFRETEGLTIQLKAVVTEHNSHWPFVDLAKELKQEHELMRVFFAVRQQIELAKKWLNTNQTPASAEHESLVNQLQQSVEEGSEIVQKAQTTDPFDLGELNQIGRQISSLLSQLQSS